MIKQLTNRASQFGMFVAVFVTPFMGLPANAQFPEGNFTFKLDQHETVLNDQATLEDLQAAIDSGLADPNDPQVAFELERAEMQQDMSSYNAKCTLISSALYLRSHPTISIGNGLEAVGGNDLDTASSDFNIIGFKIKLGSTASQYNFGNHTLNHLPALPMVVPSNTTVDADILDGGNELSIKFDNGGLLPGQMATMQIQLFTQNPGPPTAWASITNFFSEDSMLTVIFQNPNNMNIIETGPFLFEDYLDHVEMWKDQVNTPSQHIDGVVDSYEIPGGFVVPEPGSMALAFGTLGGYFLLGRRRPA